MSRARADEEEYWHSSKFRAFTFDDEDDELSQLKESKRAVNSLRDIVDDDDDDDDLERVSWSGEPVGSISWSIKETASSSTSSLEGQDSSLQKGSSSYAAFPKQVSSYSLSSLFKGRNRLPSFQSLSNALSDTGVKNYAPELRRPKAEYKDYSSDWSPKDTVKRMQRGKVCSLERFRSLQDKLVLLDEAVAGHDGNVITAVLIFLKRTLRREILFRELEVRQVALCHLIHFLKETGEQKLLLDLLRLPFSAEDTSHIQDHYTLLERQIIIEANDRHLETAGQSEIFRKYPRKASILNMPLVTTLFYSCFYHYTEAEGTFSSPTNLKKTFKVLQEYVRLVEDVETRLNLATKYKCHDVVIETYRDLKDRIQLTAYKCKVERGSAEEQNINSILNNTQIRWKN
ncbi:spermatogenesis-defective protein 39 homolog isoform X10 [Gymnogyps californianus]|uniref:spermatogenesis-defective protein 39 homolog isoform X10 n=1 Tax=Gymnogyps californianus TaxID=33616 RepID=UPI0021C7C10E|nr:spermatogenesis-defective protein 39 homolog isoform X10 [Gymnogyps californianus]